MRMLRILWWPFHLLAHELRMNLVGKIVRVHRYGHEWIAFECGYCGRLSGLHHSGCCQCKEDGAS